MRELHQEMRDGFSEVRGEISGLRTLMLQFAGGMVLGFIGLFAAVVANG